MAEHASIEVDQIAIERYWWGFTISIHGAQGVGIYKDDSIRLIEWLNAQRAELDEHQWEHASHRNQRYEKLVVASKAMVKALTGSGINTGTNGQEIVSAFHDLRELLEKSS